MKPFLESFTFSWSNRSRARAMCSKPCAGKMRPGENQFPANTPGLFTAGDLYLWQRDWVVHCKPVGCGRQALKYLAPYIFRVAIGNKRILTFENNQVTFLYRTSDTGQERRCTLRVEDFIHRFLQHVLPKGFVKVRYYGFFSAGSRKCLEQIQQLIGPAKEAPSSTEHAPETVSRSQPVHRCPVCGHAMQPGSLIPPTSGRGPP